MITVVCCFNDVAKYNTILKPSLEKQLDVQFEIVTIDNTEGDYCSAADAFNHAMKNVKYEYVVFLHQDFAFSDKYALKMIYVELSKLDYRCVIGAAGAVKDKKAGFTKKIIGRDRNIISNLKPRFLDTSTGLRKVETVDECCFALSKRLWEEHHFDNTICFSWDLYAVEMCLYARVQGGNCYVVPIRGIHLSYGKMGKDFFRSLQLLSTAYCEKIDYIITTCVVVKCGKNKTLRILFLSVVNNVRNLKNSVMRRR